MVWNAVTWFQGSQNNYVWRMQEHEFVDQYAAWRTNDPCTNRFINDELPEAIQGNT